MIKEHYLAFIKIQSAAVIHLWNNEYHAFVAFVSMFNIYVLRQHAIMHFYNQHTAVLLCINVTVVMFG